MKSIELKPTYSKGYSRLGLAYYGQGRYLEALSALRKGQDGSYQALVFIISGPQQYVAIII